MSSETTQSESSDRPSMFRWFFRPRYGYFEFSLIGSLVAVLLAFLWMQSERLNHLSKAAFRSPFPSVKAAEEVILADSETYSKSYQFTTNWFTWNVPVWKAVLERYRGVPDLRYLEIGLYEGRSALWMLENVLTDPTSRLVGIDIFDGALKDRFFANLKLSGLEARADIRLGRSQDILRTLEPESFDIIYVDGSHDTSDVLEDAVLAWKILKPGGVLIFDDYKWAGCFTPGAETRDAPEDLPKFAIDRFIDCFRDEIEFVHNSYQMIVRKHAD